VFVKHNLQAEVSKKELLPRRVDSKELASPWSGASMGQNDKDKTNFLKKKQSRGKKDDGF